MARDPVCGMYVDEEHATFTAEVDGKTYYFCSEQCMPTFVQPEVERRNLKHLVALSLALGFATMALRSVTVVSNSLLLRRFNPRR